MPIPESLKKYFWDVDWDELNRQADRFEDFIVCRIADKGDGEAVRWLTRRFPAVRIADAVGRSRSVSGKTRCFWKRAAGYL
jgi:hypothetical protein